MKVCDCCGYERHGRYIKLAMRSQEDANFDFIGATEIDMFLCRDCCARYKRSFWRMVHKYTKARAER